MPTRLDPLIEGLGEAVVSICDVFGGFSGACRRHARAEGAEHSMVEHIPGSHGRSLFMRNSVER